MKPVRIWIACWMMSAAGCAVDSQGDEEALGDEQSALGSSPSQSGLSREEQATVLKLIDDICGDTWCEGDHNFRFDRLDCQRGCRDRPGSCRLSFRLFSYDTDIETGPTYSRVCRTPDFTGLDSLVQTSGDYRSLQPAYYDALSACISRVESRLPQ